MVAKQATTTLGSIASVTIDTQNFEESISFYNRIGFVVVAQANWPFPWVQICDGVLLIMLRKGDKPQLALSWYTSDFAESAQLISQAGILPTLTSNDQEMPKRCLFASPGGVEIRVVGITDGFHKPEGKGMLHLPQDQWYNPASYHNQQIGMWGEVAIPVPHVLDAIDFWKRLGFKVMSQFEHPYPWAILSDGLMVLGLHETDHFSEPTITYFAADMAQKVAALHALGLEGLSGAAAATLLRTPEQQTMFLFPLSVPDEPVTRSPIGRTILETERLLLKEVTPEILTQLFSGYNDAEIMDYLGITDESEWESERNNYNAGLKTSRITFKNFQIHLKENGRRIGKIGFHTWYQAHSRAEIGYDISDISCRQMGYMTEAMEALIHHGFTDMSLNRIEALTGKENLPSIKLVTRYGFVKEGVLRQHYCKNGHIEDSVMWSLLATDYHPAT